MHDGLEFLRSIDAGCAHAVFFDPQYRGVLDKLAYGNEGKTRGKGRASLEQMSEQTIADFLSEIERVLIPNGYLFLWVDKFHLCQASHRKWTSLRAVDLCVWHKARIGMGYRTRRASEYCICLTRCTGPHPEFPEVWTEKVPRGIHPHRKPVEMQRALIELSTSPGDLIVDPAAGSFSVREAATDRRFLGFDKAQKKISCRPCQGRCDMRYCVQTNEKTHDETLTHASRDAGPRLGAASRG